MNGAKEQARTYREGRVRPGQSVYGADVGIILLDSKLPRPVGDVGNARTFDFPVLYEVAEGALPRHVVEEAAQGLLGNFIRTAERLLERGVRAVATSCGFLAIYQREMASALGGPVATSALLQVPLVLQLLKPDMSVGVITANAARLSSGHMRAVGITPMDQERITLIGLEDTKHFYPVIVGNSPDELELDRARSEVVAAASDALDRNPEIGAFVLECTNLPPYADSIRAVTGLPVWDVTTMVNWLESAVRSL
jgi:hypothetical protein